MKKRALILILTVILVVVSLPFSVFAFGERVNEKELALAEYETQAVTVSSTQVGEISARGAVLINADTGDILYDKNADERLPMASTTKIMTALVAVESMPLDSLITVTRESVGVEGSSIYLCEGERLTLEDLLYALLLESANDAANAIAIGVSRSVEAFAELMNERASSLGLKDTHFENPHGLDGQTHYTTARELARITQAALANEALATIVGTVRKTIAFDLDGQKNERLLINHNRLLRLYEGTVGVKTGFTKKSGRCLVSCALRDGVRLIAVTLNAPDDWDDHARMLDFGFEVYEKVTLCEPLDFSVMLPLINGIEEHITVCNPNGAYAVLPRVREDITYTVELSRFEFAPIEKGEVLGRLVFRCGDSVVGECQLVAAYGVSASVEGEKGSLANWLRRLFN
ncbi:MAG: D-alanyl-D-alanine carboxypeptidase [Clostridia bacterium]|nr:D-alanyl-D-alanine carboxypeptidase [Clostridia bacterium]